MSNYGDYFSSYAASPAYWKAANTFQSYTSPSIKYSISSGGQSGVVILDGASTADGVSGVKAASESIGYSLLLAALYNDKATFDRISAFIQAAMLASGRTLMPWTVTTSDNGQTWQVPPVSGTTDYSASASDADINIALGYIYAYQAAGVYGWSPNDSNGNSYYNLAASYIDAIRNLDFAANDPNLYNRYILADGSDQAASGGLYSWHPDYSDPRAYQLFQYFDSDYATFWDSAEAQALTSWKAVFDFGSSDLRTQQSGDSTIDFATQNSSLSNATYGSIQAASTYSDYTGQRYSTTYDADSQRMPIRLLNFMQAAENAGQTEMTGIADSMLSALGASFQNGNAGGSNQIANGVTISSPYAQPGSPGYTQDYTAAGLLALAANSSTTWSNKDTIFSNLDGRFGVTGMGSGDSTQIQNNLSGDSGFNDSISLWALTVAAKGGSNVSNPLQAAINQIQSASSLYSLTTNDLTNFSGDFNVTVFKSAAYGTELSFYKTIGEKGGVVDVVTGAIVLPGDLNYAKAAQDNIANLGTFSGVDERATTALLEGHEAKGFQYAPIATVDDVRYGRQVYFAFAAANGDGKDHFRMNGDRTMSFEDMYNLGDADFNDLKISFSMAS
jgi:hypothetical protein